MKRTLTLLTALLLAPLAALHAADAPPASLARDFGPAANLLKNPSFEEKEGDGVEGWTSRAWAGKEAIRWSVETQSRTGEYCVSIASNRGGDAAWTAMVIVQPGAWYRLSGWIKTREVRGAVGALLNIQNMQGVRTPAVSGTREWTRVETVFQAEAATNLEINCLFGGWGTATGQAWYDDVGLDPIAGPPEETWAAVTIDTGAPSVPYSPMIFGGFLEHFDNQIYGGIFDPGSPLADEKGFRADVLAALKEMKVPVIRWPGGCFVDAYHWQKGVGKNRESYGHPVWGEIEPNTFGTHEFIEFCRRIGAEPYICHNGLSGVQENVDWVAYCNSTEGKFADLRKENGHPEPFNVKFWSVGNERYDKAYIDRVRDTAKAVKASYPIVQMTCAASQDGTELSSYLIDTAGEYLDLLSVHAYWLPRGDQLPRFNYMTAIGKSEAPDVYLTAMCQALDKVVKRKILKIAFDEWNLRAWQHPGFPRGHVDDYHAPAIRELVERRLKGNNLAEQYTMADALFSASFFNACLRHADDVVMANVAPLVNTRGPLFVHPKGIVKRTHFHTMAMYANELESRVGKLSMEVGKLGHGTGSVSVADAIGTVDEAGKQWAIALVNRHPAKPVSCTVRMKDRLLDGEYAALVLAGDSPEAFNDIENPNRVTPQRTTLTFTKGAVNLPPHSLTIVKVPLK